MEIGNFNIPIEKDKIYTSLELSTMIISNSNDGIYFLNICRDFNSFNWNMEVLFGELYEKDGEIYTKLSNDCVNYLIEAKDEGLSENDVLNFVKDIENTPIADLTEENKKLIEPQNQENINIYVIFRDNKPTLYALFAETMQEHLLNYAVIYADMFDFCGVKEYNTFKLFIDSVRMNFRKYFSTTQDPFNNEDIFIEEEIDEEQTDLEDDDWDYIVDEKPAKLITFNKK